MKTNKERIGIVVGVLFSLVFFIFGAFTLQHFGFAFPDTDKFIAYMAISIIGFCLGVLIIFISTIYGRQEENKIIIDVMDEYIQDDIKNKEDLKNGNQ